MLTFVACHFSKDKVAKRIGKLSLFIYIYILKSPFLSFRCQSKSLKKIINHYAEAEFPSQLKPRLFSTDPKKRECQMCRHCVALWRGDDDDEWERRPAIGSVLNAFYSILRQWNKHTTVHIWPHILWVAELLCSLRAIATAPNVPMITQWKGFRV